MAVNMEDDDLFLVIVEDEDQQDVPLPIQIITKQEPLDETESKLALQEIIENVEKHGQFIDVKINQSIHDEYEYLEDELLSEIKPEIKLEEIQEEYVIPADTEPFQLKKKVHKMRYKPLVQKSFVEDLREQYPELRKDVKLLISTLAVIMKNLKPPPPPEYHYIQYDEVYQCVQCDIATESEAAAARHYQEKHGQRYLMCYACGVDFRSATNLYKHEKRCKARDARIVLKARATCVGSRGRSRPYLHLAKTMFLKDAQNTFDCKLCSAKFITKNTLIAHENMHNGKRPYQCHACPNAYTSYSALVRHTACHSNIEYICDHCGRSFKQKMALVAHMDTHRPQRKYGCEDCGKRFAQKFAVKLHADRVHRNLPPPCACMICPKRFPRMFQLKRHMKIEHGFTIFTRKMFFKMLPKLTPNQVEQAAKLVLNTDDNNQGENGNGETWYRTPDDLIDEENEESEVIVPDNLLSDDFRKIMYKFEKTEVLKRKKK